MDTNPTKVRHTLNNLLDSPPAPGNNIRVMADSVWRGILVLGNIILEASRVEQ